MNFRFAKYFFSMHCCTAPIYADALMQTFVRRLIGIAIACIMMSYSTVPIIMKKRMAFPSAGLIGLCLIYVTPYPNAFLGSSSVSVAK